MTDIEKIVKRLESGHEILILRHDVKELVFDLIADWKRLKAAERKWIKVTPETMPSQGQDSLITRETKAGERHVFSAVWCGTLKKWFDTYGEQQIDGIITHWMPYPEPAVQE